MRGGERSNTFSFLLKIYREGDCLMSVDKEFHKLMSEEKVIGMGTRTTTG